MLSSTVRRFASRIATAASPPTEAKLSFYIVMRDPVAATLLTKMDIGKMHVRDRHSNLQPR
jgi:hypothetical protein